MKIVNYHKDNYSYDNEGYVIHGAIIMDKVEFTDVCYYLKREKQTATEKIDTYIRDSLKLCDIDTKTPYTCGVTASKLIAEHYGLRNYKDQNYWIIIK
ncbi:MAG: hypothetical protein WC933_02730 [Candidatus Paceibacterota bacterium]|jgi:hypothetical protein